MSTFHEESYVNDLGQPLNPGDPVIFIATSYKSTRVEKGVFAGVYRADVFYSRYQLDDNGIAVRDEKGYPVRINRKENQVVGLSVKDIPVIGLGAGEWVVDPATGKRSYKYTAYDKPRVIKYRRSKPLWLKRVYRIDMPLEQLAGKYI